MLDLAKGWHRQIMAGLDVPRDAWVGCFRGEQGVEGVEVAVGGRRAVEASEVGEELAAFIRRLRAAVSLLDERIPEDSDLSARQLHWILRTGAWVHAEWVRIHPFVNGNGRTARLWVNWLLMRYGIPPVVRLRPRPEQREYVQAAAAAMEGDWQPMLEVLESMLP